MLKLIVAFRIGGDDMPRSRDQIFEELRVLMVDKMPDLHLEDIALATMFEDLRIDSLAMVEVLMAVEEQFNTGDIPEEEADKIKNVGDLVDYIESHQS